MIVCFIVGVAVTAALTAIWRVLRSEDFGLGL